MENFVQYGIWSSGNTPSDKCSRITDNSYWTSSSHCSFDFFWPLKLWRFTILLTNGILLALLLSPGNLSGYKAAADPAKLTAIQLIDTLVQIEGRVCAIYVRKLGTAMTNQLTPSLRTKSLVLIFPLAVTLLYTPVLLKLLLLRRLVMLTRTTLKPMLLSRRTSIRLVFAFFMFRPMLIMLPALVLHLTLLIHTLINNKQSSLNSDPLAALHTDPISPILDRGDLTLLYTSTRHTQVMLRHWNKIEHGLSGGTE